LYRLSTQGKKKEGFHTQTEWDKFIQIQNTINPKIVFDINQLKKQVGLQEVVDFNKNGKWNWTDKTKELYLEAIRKNPIVKISPESSLNYAMTIYNEPAIIEVLRIQSSK
jgi:hypothetical protein